MHKNILIAGVVIAITAGAAMAQTGAQRPANPPPPAAGQPAAGQPDGPGPGFRGAPGFRRGPGGPGFGGFRGRFRQPPTAQQVQQRNAALVARLDANKDGRVTFEEFRAEQERRRMERQRRMFERFSGEKDSFTLDQLNARSLERLNDRGQRRGFRGGPDGRGPDGRGRGGQPGQPPAAPAAR
jgi:hypothetical protein